MFKQKLTAVGVAILLTSLAQAGEIRLPYWPSACVPQEISEIPVVMDVGYWVRIINQDAVLKLQQVAIRKYQGCVDLQVLCNFNLTLSCSIDPTGTVAGNYGCKMYQGDVDPPGGTASVCATLNDADLLTYGGGSKDVHVATITIRVAPRS